MSESIFGRADRVILLRNHAIWSLLAQGAPSDEIAEALNVPESTVNQHREIQRMVNRIQPPD